MQKDLTLRDPSSEEEEEKAHPFSPAHFAALQEGASRRKKEQIVGNWIRVTHPALFAQLLNEASKTPRSEVLESLDSNALLTPTQRRSAEAQTKAQGAAEVPNLGLGALKGGEDYTSPRTSEAPQYRKPPPQLNIT